MKTRRTVRVTIEKEVTIEFPDSMLTPEYLADFRNGLFAVESINDVFKYAARMAADRQTGCNHDMLGLLDYHYSTYPRVPDVKVWQHDETYEEEIVDDWVFKDEVQS